MAPQSSVATKRNPGLVDLIHSLKKQAQDQEAPVWRDVARRLEKPTREHVAVNVSRLERTLAAQEVAVVPGKLLAAGQITKPVTVAAFGASAGARAKVEKAGGKVLTIPELVKANPDGTKIRIIG